MALALGALAALDGCAAGHPSAATPTPVPPAPKVIGDARWAGELFRSSDGFKSVSARWRVPTATCGSGETAYVYSWVGLGGWDSDGALEQIGTLEGCYRGMQRYRSFWEFWPARPAFGDDPTTAQDPYPVAPGDIMSASVTQGSRGAYDVTETNATEGWTVTRSGTSPAYLSHAPGQPSGPGNTTAEVVQEEATKDRFALPDYSSVDFTGVAPTSLGSAPSTAYLVTTVADDDLIAQEAAAQADRVTVLWMRRS
jgi:hypothetical protein